MLLKMVKILSVLVLIFTLITSCSKNREQTYSVRGVVKDINETPIANTRVIVDGKGTYTNADGTFYIENIPTGEQEIDVLAEGFHCYYNRINISPYIMLPLKIILEKSKSQMKLFHSNIFILSKASEPLIPSIPGAQGSPFGSYLNDQPPIIYSITQIPQIPVSNEKVNIIARIMNDIEKTDDITIEANLYYSIDDGKNWTKINLIKDQDDYLWRGEIPPQNKGTKVIYYFQAKDTAGNLTTEVPGANMIWPPSENEIPVLTPPVSDEDCDKNLTPDELDILDFAVGMNDTTIFGMIGIQDKVSGGYICPTRINSYVIGVINPDRGEDILKGVGIGYSPLNPLIYELPQICAIDERTFQTNQPIPQEESGTDINVNNNIIYWKVNRSLLGNNPSGILKFISTTGYRTSYAPQELFTGSPKDFYICDASSYILLYLRNHSYTVN